MSIFWLVLAVLLAIIEAITPQLVSIWFALGALGGCITSLFTGNIWIQVSVAVILSVVVLIATRPISKRLTKAKVTHTNSDRNIGKIAVVITDIDNVMSTGRVKVGADVWSAKSLDNAIIKADSKVEVVSIEGAKLVVRTCD